MHDQIALNVESYCLLDLVAEVKTSRTRSMIISQVPLTDDDKHVLDNNKIRDYLKISYCPYIRRAFDITMNVGISIASR